MNKLCVHGESTDVARFTEEFEHIMNISSYYCEVMTGRRVEFIFDTLDKTPTAQLKEAARLFPGVKFRLKFREPSLKIQGSETFYVPQGQIGTA